jgi:hypothetical protein
MALGAMLAVAVVQPLLIPGVLDFDVQVLLLVAAFLRVYAWVFVVSCSWVWQAPASSSRSSPRGMINSNSQPRANWSISARLPTAYQLHRRGKSNDHLGRI